MAPLSSKARSRLQLLGSAVCFGLMAVLARRLSRGADPFAPGQLAVVRFAIGVAVSLVAFRLRPGLHRPRDHRLLWTRGISGGIVVVLYFLALARIPAGEAGMLYNLFPVVATLMAIVAFRERPTVHLLIGILAATGGVVLVLGGGSLSLGLGYGEAFAVAAAIFAAFSSVVIRAMRATENAPTIFFYFCLGGLPVALPFALGTWPHAPSAWALAAVMGLAAFGAQLLMSEAYGSLTIGEAAAWLQLTPLAQYLLAVPLLGEAPTLTGLAGILVGVAGIAWATALGHRGGEAFRSPGRPS